MIIDKTHSRWLIGTLSSLAVLSLGYAVSAHSAHDGPSGGSLAGLAFGTLAALLMLFAFLLGLRRRFPAVHVGSGQLWLRGHLWLGGLTVPLVLFHSGFRFGGPLEQALMWSFVIVVVTGVYGLVVQHFLPRLMWHVVPDETFVEQIPFVCTRNLVMCDRAVARDCGKIATADDALTAEFQRLIVHSDTLAREDRDRWLDAVDPEMHELLRSLARRAKDDNWTLVKDGKPGAMRMESDFPMALSQIYSFNGLAQTPNVPKADSRSVEGNSAGGSVAGSGAVPAAGEPKAARPRVLQHAARRAPADAAAVMPDTNAGVITTTAVAPVEAAPAAAMAAGSPKLSSAAAALQAKLAAKKAGVAAPAAAVSDHPAPTSAPAPAPVTGQPLEPAPAPAVPVPSTLSPAAAALQAKLTAKKAGSAAPATAAAEHPAPANPSTPAPVAEQPVKQAPAPAAPGPSTLSPAAAALQAKLAAKKAGVVATAPLAADGAPILAPIVETPSEAVPAAPAATSLSTATAALQAKLAAKKAELAAPAAAPEQSTATSELAPGPAAPLPAKVSTASAALQAKLAAKKKTVQTATAAAGTNAAPQPAAAAPAQGDITPAEKPPANLPKKLGLVGNPPAIAAKEPDEKVPEHSLHRLRGFYLGEARPFLREKPRRSPLMDLESSKRLFAQLRGELPVRLHAALGQIEHYCTERRQLLHLARLHWQLHWWLGVHIPASVAVVVLMLIHIVFALRVVPFFN